MSWSGSGAPSEAGCVISSSFTGVLVVEVGGVSLFEMIGVAWSLNDTTFAESISKTSVHCLTN